MLAITQRSYWIPGSWHVRIVYTDESRSTISDRSPTVQVNIKNLIDDVQCYQTVRELRWPDGVACPSCESQQASSVAVMTQSRPVNAMSVTTVIHGLMI